jgi:hypothetical protein
MAEVMRFLRYALRRGFWWKFLAFLGLTLTGYACAILSVHGPDYFAFVGYYLLYPNYALAHSGSVRSIFYEISFLNILIFFVLQFLYLGGFYLLWIYSDYVFSRPVRPPDERQSA